jgi:hypothetical protein
MCGGAAAGDMGCEGSTFYSDEIRGPNVQSNINTAGDITEYAVDLNAGRMIGQHLLGDAEFRTNRQKKVHFRQRRSSSFRL